MEVGVNVPNATVMMVENAERFGLAQLHQLRGRVGRGQWQSYCIFIHGKNQAEKSKRLQILNKSNDGFYIAQEDLKLRGPGDLFGVRQSGDLNFEIADIFRDASILKKASDAAGYILSLDGTLELPQHRLLKEKLEEYAKETETAICVISRNSGEGNDRFMKKEVSIGDKRYEIGDYRLSAVEMDNLKKLRSAFSSLILVLNVPGSISVQDLEAACADAILLMGQAGQEGGAAVTDILTGKATPSGKLTATWAKNMKIILRQAISFRILIRQYIRKEFM